MSLHYSSKDKRAIIIKLLAAFSFFSVAYYNYSIHDNSSIYTVALPAFMLGLVVSDLSRAIDNVVKNKL